MDSIYLGNSIAGTMFKSMISAQPIDGVTLSQMDFSVEVYALGSPKTKTYRKDELIFHDENSYMVTVDSNELGAGAYWATITVSIPDNDFSTGVRVEKYEIPLGVTINRRRR